MCASAPNYVNGVALMMASDASRTERSSREAYGTVITVFMLCAGYLAVPVFEIPVVGLSLSAPLMLVAGAGLLLRGKLYYGRRYRPFNWAFGVLTGNIVVAAIMAAIFADTGHRMPSATPVIRFLYLGVVCFITMRIVVEANIEKRLTRWLAAGVKVLVLCLMLTVFTGVEIMTPNMYAIQLTMFSPFLLPGLLQKGLGRVTTTGWFALIWSLSLLNGSRQGLLILTLQFLVFVVAAAIYSRKRKRITRLVPVMVIIIVTGMWVGVSIGPGDVVSYASHKIGGTQSLEYDKSWQTRVVLNQRSVKVFQQSPVVGVGLGGLKDSEVELNIPWILRHTSDDDLFSLSAHNSHLQILAESGVIGFAPWVLLIIMLVWGGLSVLPHELRRERYFVLACLIAVLGMVVQMWVITAHMGTGTHFLFACLAASVIKSRQRIRSEGL